MHRDIVELHREITYHLQQAYHSAGIKLLLGSLAAVPALFSSKLFGSWQLLQIWFYLSLVDLCFGVALALRTPGKNGEKNAFSRRRLYGWVIKCGTHLGVIILFGLLSVGLFIVSGVVVPVINVFMFGLACTEAGSIVDTAIKLKLPVPIQARKLVGWFVKKSDRMVDGPEGSSHEKGD